MPRKCRAILAVVIANVAFGQAKPEEPVKTTVCELAQAPKRFNGRMVTVRAELKSQFEWGGLVDGDCSLLVSVDGFPDLESHTGEYAFVNTISDLKYSDKLAWNPIQLPPRVQPIENRANRELEKYSFQRWKRADGSICFDCPLFSITVTVTGRFDHVETSLIAIRANRKERPNAYSAGFGHLNASRTRLVWQSVSDVVAIPIDPAIYEKRK